MNQPENIIIEETQTAEEIDKTDEQAEKKEISRPSSDVIAAEIKRMKKKSESRSVIVGAIKALMFFAAMVAVMITLWFPVVRVHQSSMSPTLTAGDILLLMKTGDINKGDIIAFYNGNQILVKRVIATGGEWVDITPDGTVSIMGEVIDEPYAVGNSINHCDIELPFKVPDGQLFLMGDSRDVSIDSRASAIGAVDYDNILGKLLLKVWPTPQYRL